MLPLQRLRVVRPIMKNQGRGLIFMVINRKNSVGVATKPQAGFSLIEILLLLTVLALFFALSFSFDTRKTEKLKIDKTVLQMQSILNAGLLYYINTGDWPNYGSGCSKVSLSSAASALQTTSGYLPNVAMPTVFAASNANYMHVSSSDTTGDCSHIQVHTFAVLAQFAAAGAATTKQTNMAYAIAARLPNGYVDTTNNLIEAFIYPPGQDPNDATALNFAGLYHQGACVPVPTCPATPPGTATTYTAQVFLTPTSVSGMNDSGSTAVYPISSFSAYASGSASAAPAACSGSTAGFTPTCSTGTVPDPTSSSGLYWRACLQVITERGDVQVTRSDAWGENVTIAAFTRCAIDAEPSGSGFDIYGN